MDDRIDFTRRKALAAIGSIGVASAGAGLGTSAYFSDQETFGNNQLTAGELDMKVSWAEHYSDWSEDEAEFASMADGELVIDDQEGFMNATLQEQFPDKQTRTAIDEGDADPCEELADVPDDLEKPVIEIEDVKPGDFGEVTFDFALCDNPGYVWLNGEILDASENGLTEPEADDPDEEEGVVELLDEIQVTVWHDDGDNVLEDTETIVTDREFDPDPTSSAIAVSGEDRIIARGTLREVLTQLSVEDGIPLDADPTTDDRDCFTNSPTIHYLGFAWELPVDHANEIQSDSVEFDLGFYTEQCRHNEGVGLATDLEAYYPLDGNADDASGNGHDGALQNGPSFAGGVIGDALSLTGGSDYVRIPNHPELDLTDAFSISVWINTSQTQPSYGRLISREQSGSGNRQYNLGFTSGGQRPRTVVDTQGTTGVEVSGTTDITDGNWYHVVVTFDSNDSLGLYVDGTPEDQTSVAAPVVSRASDLTIGGVAQSPADFQFNGLTDDVRIYSRALSDSEVQAIYDAA